VNSLRRVLGIVLLAVLMSGCWPTPGQGPDRRSFNPFERTLTAATVGDLTEVFRAPLADGAGPPVVTGDGLFVRTGLSIAAFEPRTGAPRWSVRLPDAPPGETDQWFSVSDPYLAGGGRVLATQTMYRAGGFIDVDLVTLGTDSGASTRRFAGGILNSLRGTAVGQLKNESNSVGSFQWIHIEHVDGGEQWGGLAFELGGPAVGSLAADRFFVSTATQVQSYDTTTPCPLVDQANVRICSTEWVRPLESPTPVVIGDDTTVYVGSSASLIAIDTVAGGIRWRSSLTGRLTVAPALADGVLYAASADGTLSAVPAGGCGGPLCGRSWSSATGAAISVQPAVAGDVVYVGSADGTLLAFAADGCGAATCEPLWTTNAGAPITGGLAVYSGRLYVGTQAGLVAYGLPA
jgi:outer membrane protein assembly factor BamB